LTPAHQKALLRSLIRRVTLTRPVPARLEVTIVWVSGAVTSLVLPLPTYRTTELAASADLAARIPALSQTGASDQAIAERLSTEGFRSARQPSVAKELVGKIRRAQGGVAVRQRFRAPEPSEGQWTTHGLAQARRVRRTWLYARILAGAIPAVRHPVTGHYLIPDAPLLIDDLRQQVPAHERSPLPERALS
jgi:hypothetical protein